MKLKWVSQSAIIVRLTAHLVLLHPDFMLASFHVPTSPLQSNCLSHSFQNGHETHSNNSGARGYALTLEQSMRETVGILLDRYDPERNPKGWTILGVAENYCMLPSIAATLHRTLASRLSADDMSYNEGPCSTRRLREAMAGFINKRFQPIKEVEESELCAANGLRPLRSMPGFVCCEQGDGILISQPCYRAFVEDFGRVAGGKLVMVSFRELVNSVWMTCVAMSRR